MNPIHPAPTRRRSLLGRPKEAGSEHRSISRACRAAQPPFFRHALWCSRRSAQSSPWLLSFEPLFRSQCTAVGHGLVIEFRLYNNQPRPEAVVLGRPPEGAVYVRLPPLGAWSWSGPGFSQAPAEASPLMTNSRLIQCHARVLPSPDQNGKSTPDRSKLFGSHGQRPWF